MNSWLFAAFTILTIRGNSFTLYGSNIFNYYISFTWFILFKKIIISIQQIEEADLNNIWIKRKM